MTISNRDARTLLTHYEGLADADPNKRFTRSFAKSELTVTREHGEFAYIWGGNTVSKFVAIMAIETFTDATRLPR